MIVARGGNDKFCTVYAFNTFFYSTYKEHRYNSTPFSSSCTAFLLDKLATKVVYISFTKEQMKRYASGRFFKVILLLLKT